MSWPTEYAVLCRRVVEWYVYYSIGLYRWLPLYLHLPPHLADWGLPERFEIMPHIQDALCRLVELSETYRSHR